MKFDFSSSKKKLVRLAFFLVALVVLLGISHLTRISVSFEEFFYKAKVTIGQLFSLGIMILAVMIGKNLIALLLDAARVENSRAKTVITIVQSLLQYIAWIIIICWGLRILGVDVATIVASLGVLALIIGFGAESLIADLVTGLFMVIENQYNVGDIIEISGFRGTVSSIGIRTTCVQDTSGNVKIINNSSMVNVLNRSDNASKAVADFPVPYATDLVKLEGQLDKILEEIYENHKDIMEDKPKYCGVQTLGASEIVLRFVVQVEDKDIYSAARILNRDLLLAFRAIGVECPFPQLDVHNV